MSDDLAALYDLSVLDASVMSREAPVARPAPRHLYHVADPAAAAAAAAPRTQHPTHPAALPAAAAPPSPTKRKHVCATCDRSFTTSGHLARHTRIHTGERNHKCPFPGCETRCSRQDNLQQHYRIHLSTGSRRSSAKARVALSRAKDSPEVSAPRDPRPPTASSSGSSTRRTPSPAVGAPIPEPPDTPPPLAQAPLSALLAPPHSAASTPEPARYDDRPRGEPAYPTYFDTHPGDRRAQGALYAVRAPAPAAYAAPLAPAPASRVPSPEDAFRGGAYGYPPEYYDVQYAAPSPTSASEAGFGYYAASAPAESPPMTPLSPDAAPAYPAYAEYYAGERARRAAYAHSQRRTYAAAAEYPAYAPAPAYPADGYATPADSPVQEFHAPAAAVAHAYAYRAQASFDAPAPSHAHAHAQGLARRHTVPEAHAHGAPVEYAAGYPYGQQAYAV